MAYGLRDGITCEKVWTGHYKVEYRGLELGRVHLRGCGRWQWMSLRSLQSGWGATLSEATDGLVRNELIEF